MSQENLQDNLDTFIKNNIVSEEVASSEQLKTLQAFSKKKDLQNKIYRGAALCSVFALLVFGLNLGLNVGLNQIMPPTSAPDQSTELLTESELIFFDDMFAFESDESTESDEDLYMYSELITL